MKKILLPVLIGLIFLWICPAFGQSDRTAPQGERMAKLDLIQSIEKGDLPWKNFVEAIKDQTITLDEISPSATANYLEALANEGLLDSIPFEYFDHEDLRVSLSVVFEDPLNICHNRSVYRDHLE
jgi:hypothetical protein